MWPSHLDELGTEHRSQSVSGGTQFLSMYLYFTVFYSKRITDITYNVNSMESLQI